MRLALRAVAVAALVALPLVTAAPASAGLIDDCLEAAQSPLGVVVIEIVKCLPDPA
ncbi:MAG TPA: hypothetical protein VGX28_03115 [Frankiaceae bacterium]|jgi:hypothetical protein|nr:hypothetical protein [Frankiaceae bacterium]